ncbi:PucR family transcriptional regulator [Bacillus massiliglaciei]|uniref:PucR family transcriptional regulator n=1 Tax=Bacillus massiliglaciei TaxID=1816693 RepID=UPI000B223F19|nr:helix-turn-helix domain-containing protein [Bacillus massiliglaciei]
MITKLLKKYPNAIVKTADRKKDQHYIWFSLPSQEIIGIPQDDISKDELSLLETLFIRLSEADSSIPGYKQQWKEFLLQSEAPIPVTNWSEARVLQFQLAQADDMKEDFEEAFLSLVGSDAILLWESPQSGLLIEGASPEKLVKIELIPIIQTLESDFYTKILMFLGNFHKVDQSFPLHFSEEVKCFQGTERPLANRKVADLADALPYLLAEKPESLNKKWFVEQLLGEASADAELLKTVKTYIESNSNATLAAKKLYIHRNSLQYRVDKFIDKTGLDIRAFPHSLTAYFLILLDS